MRGNGKERRDQRGGGERKGVERRIAVRREVKTEKRGEEKGLGVTSEGRPRGVAVALRKREQGEKVGQRRRSEGACGRGEGPLV